MAFKMKNQALNNSVRTGSPMQANYASPTKKLDVWKGHPMSEDSEKLSSNKEGYAIEESNIEGAKRRDSAYTQGKITDKTKTDLEKKVKNVYYTGDDAINAAVEHGADYQTVQSIKRGEIGTKEHPYSKETKFVSGKKSPVEQSYPSSSKTGPHGPRGTLDVVKKIAKKKARKQLIKRGLSRLIPGVGAGLMAYDILKRGIKNVKEGKAKIPKGYYEKGGEGYQKRDYSKKVNYNKK